MTTPSAGSAQIRVRAIAHEIFDSADLSAATLTPAHIARSAAFIVLAHAEMEEVIEKACLGVAGSLRTAADPSLAMVVWGMTSIRADGTYQKPKRRTPTEEIVRTYEIVVNSNHGIKQQNLEAMLVPLGVDMAALKTDVIDLDTFGTRRGELAHRSLARWGTSDLPSRHVVLGIQAAQSADRVAAAILTAHGSVVRAKGRNVSLRNQVARTLRRIANVLD